MLIKKKKKALNDEKTSPGVFFFQRANDQNFRKKNLNFVQFMFQKLSLNDSNFKFVIAIEKRRVLYIVRAWIVN